MGIISRGILGGFKNKVANVVGSSWKGIAVIKALPLSVANPRTAAQQTQRGNFAGIVAIAKPMLSGVIKPLWDRFAHQMSGYNAFVQANISVMDGLVIDKPLDLVISRGTLYTPPLVSVEIISAGDAAQVTWNPSTIGQNGQSTDVIYCVLIDIANSKVLAAKAIGERADGTTTVDAVGGPVTATTRAYLAARSADLRNVSNTSNMIASI